MIVAVVLRSDKKRIELRDTEKIRDVYDLEMD